MAGRDGGLQSMELLGMVMLRISDPEFSKIRVVVDNKDQRSLQFQVFALYFVVHMCAAILWS